jgi:hypothetical protein
MATAQRVFWETVAVLAFLVILVAAYLWSGYRADAARARLAAQHDRQTQLVAEQQQSAIQELEAEHRRLFERETEARARAAYSGFAAGVHTAIVARWGNYLATAIDRFAESPAVAFVHVASPGGRVIASSDVDIRAAGTLDESGAWALAAKSVVTRAGASDLLELAGPVLAEGRVVATLWIGYDPARDSPSAAPGPAQ